MIDLPFRPDRGAEEPLYRQLEAYLRSLIETGRMPAGTKLPATREMAEAVGVARVTVVQAYASLVSSGLLHSHVGRGTFVAAPAASTRAEAPETRSFVWSGLFALRARELAMPAGIAVRNAGELRFDFRGGQVDRESLPIGDVRSALERALRRHGGELAVHGDPYGWPPFRREVARMLLGRGIRCEPEEIAVVSGAQQAVDLAARVLVDPGDSVAIEQPGYFGAALAFQAAQANLVGVGVDEDGLRTAELERVLRARRVKVVFTTPAVQSPTGVVMSEARRRQLLELASEHQTAIFEDDYAAELRFRGEAVGALKALDRSGQVIYAGTFSKTLFPNLRLGFVVAPRELLRKMVLARWNADGGAALAPQMVVASLLRTGAFDRHLRRLRRVYAERLQTMLAALRATMPPGTRWTEPSAGQAIWLTLPAGVDGEAVFRDAIAAGIAYSRGDAFHIDGQGLQHASLSFARLPAARVATGIEELAAVVRRHLPAAGLRGARDSRSDAKRRTWNPAAKRRAPHGADASA